MGAFSVKGSNRLLFKNPQKVILEIEYHKFYLSVTFQSITLPPPPPVKV
jgi:hypothetical protein